MNFEKHVELDVVARKPRNAKGLVLRDVKWRKLLTAGLRHVHSQLEQKWHRTALSRRHSQARRLVFDAMEVLRPEQ